ncbi:MAG: DUF3488 domain-containing protein [Deltaproteobacteria bacterium]|nr:DUF3488 domain-containing protein [Deltaproteobacteria bacterium]
MTRLPLAVVLAAALAALGRSLDSVVAYGLALVAVLGAGLSVRLDPSIERLARLLSRVAVVAAVLAGWVLTVAPMLHGERTDDVLRSVGLVLAACALPLSIHSYAEAGAGARPRADAAVLLAAMGIFGIAGLHRLVEIRPFFAVGGAAAAVHAMLAVHGAARSGRRPSIARGAFAVLIAATLAGTIALGLPPAQRQLERALLSGRVIELKGRSGLSNDDVRVGEVQSLARSERPVLRVYGPAARYLRAQVYLRFDGRLWHALRTNKPVEPQPVDAVIGARAEPLLARMGGALRLFPGVRADALAGDEVIASRIEPIDLDEGLLVTPGDALAVKTEDEVRVAEAGLLLRSDRRQPDPYVVVHRRRIGVGDDRAPDDATLPLAVSLPRRVDDRLRALADRLARGDDAPEGAPLLPVAKRIERTVAYVRAAARYTLDAPRYAGPDIAAELLFDKRAGYCEHFASALAILLRLERIPTRYVTGFRVDEGDLEGEHYLVRDDNAHAWVEAWDGTAWLELDATPIAEYTTLHRRSKSGWAARAAAIRAFFADLRAAIRYGRATDLALQARWPIAIALSALGVAYVARNEVRRRLADARGKRKVRARDKLAPELEAFLRELDAAWHRAGHPRPRSSGLKEHAAATEARGIDPGAAEAIRAAIEPLHRAAYGGETPSSEQLATARERLRQSFRRRRS